MIIGCHLQVLRDHPRGSLPQGRPSRPQDELDRRPHPQAPRDEGSDLRWQEVQGSPWQGSQLHQVQALEARRLEEEQQGLAQALPLNLVVVAYAASNHPGGICCCCPYQHRLSLSSIHLLVPSPNPCLHEINTAPHGEHRVLFQVPRVSCGGECCVGCDACCS